MSTARPFTGVTLDRADAERKNPARLRTLLADPAAVTVFAGADGVLVDDTGEALLRAPLPAGPPEDRILLGLDADRPVFACDLDALPGEARHRLDGGGAAVVSLREAGTALTHAEAGLAAYAAAMLNWHRRHRFCANCGAATEAIEGGAARRCSSCGATHFPRTDPVVIMTVTHRDRLLLGRRAGWPQGRVSVLAGFVSPGESVEEAVLREVREEAAIVARDPRYVASQPWPFPASLMLGFDAQCDGGEPRARDGELAEVGWYGVEELRAANAGEHPTLQLPGEVSIARFLIERWLAQRL
ncbi:MAG TPA: NAD(+) diphosphatase [Solirubrobacteraceae bacterium]|nr:NAD(+) diphosphatase [Solirubrobacteraceae bacterium]